MREIRSHVPVFRLKLNGLVVLLLQELELHPELQDEEQTRVEVFLDVVLLQHVFVV